MTQRRLPVRQLVILSICRFAEPIALTSVFPYVPELMESFGVPENDIARWAGITSATFSLCQACTGLIWGAASDRYGRKPIILLGLFNTMWTMLLWGFSTNLPMGIAARALQGLGNGNVGILRTTVAELCPWKELQPRAFSIMPLVYTIGAIFGPTLGGALSNPLRVDPRAPRGSNFLERFPYVLPNIVAATFFTIGIVTGWLFLKETLASKKHERDLGLETGEKITAFFRRRFSRKEVQLFAAEEEPLLGRRKGVPDVEEVNSLETPNTPVREEAPRIRDVLTTQTTLNLGVYTALALYTLAYDQLLPVFLHHPPQSLNDPNVSLPFKFAGGFGIDSRRIGAIFTFFAVTSTLCQFLVFPPLARHLGVLYCLRASFLIFPVIFLITPFISLIPDNTAKLTVLICVLMVRGVCGTFAFPTSTIMLTNSASSLQVLGTINGLATSVSAVGRAMGPALGGGLFTAGVKRGYVILPFWTMAAISLAASVPTFWLEEGKGFGDDVDAGADEANAENVATGNPHKLDTTTQTPRYIVIDEEVTTVSGAGVPDAAGADGDINFLSHTSTRSSAAVASSDGGGEISEQDNENEDHGSWLRPIDSRDRALDRTRSYSQAQHQRSKSLRRRSSVPIGMGKGFRRYSTNLGSTGVGAPGTSWGGT